MILFDTCTLLWLSSDQARLSQAAVSAWENSSDRRYLSAISIFEIAQKVASKKLSLPQTLSKWRQELARLFSLEEIPVNSSVAIKAAALPPIHKDPFDRLIIATALIHKLTIVTCDEKIIQYPRLKTLW
jgi:PIN domain nuclease of toxin-antitoxin system